MKSRLLYTLFIVLILVNFSSGQTIHSFLSTTGSLADVKKGSFVTLEGGFSIDLPRQFGGFTGTKGSQFSWRLKEGYYFIGSEQRSDKIENTEAFEGETLKVIDSLFSDIARDLFATKYEVKGVERKPIVHDGHSGIDARATLTNAVVLIRVFWVDSKVFKLGVLLTPPQMAFEPQAKPLFDSLKVMSTESLSKIIKKKVEEGTPEPLPQSPVAAKARSDADDERLNGRVRSVVQENQFAKGQKAGTPKQKDFEYFYNESGNLTKSVYYDDTSGFPSQISVYGYVGRSRVARLRNIRYGNELIGIALAAPGVTRQDNRYDERYVYTYDTAKRLIAKSTYDNAGQLWTRLVYKHRTNAVEELLYDQSNKLNSRSLVKFDQNGREIERTDFSSPLEGWNSIYTFKYEEVDPNGNWTKRTVTKSTSVQKTTKEEWVMVETRDIEYY